MKKKYNFSQKPPIGLMPEYLYYEQIKRERLNDVRGAIARYYDAELKIPIQWIQEYNDLIEYFKK
jgi:hypothetical protein